MNHLDRIKTSIDAAIGPTSSIPVKDQRQLVQALTQLLGLDGAALAAPELESAASAGEPAFNYFQACLGDSFNLTHLGPHEAVHPVRVKEVLAEFAGTRAADVIASLVRDRELSRLREDRWSAELIELRAARIINTTSQSQR
ncbi:hypothetical protein [Paucibacter soli]|uniref:hypothetical protein n=1 Tax=Paucibacter soli TaxID=3133433 RepID=UPI0030A88DC5